MDIAIGIKNALLVLLIILSIHVYLINREPFRNSCVGPKMKEQQQQHSKPNVLVANCNLVQDKKNMMIINEYENDKVKEGDIPAFDDYEINYEYYLQAEKAAESQDAINDKGGFGDFMSA